MAGRPVVIVGEAYDPSLSIGGGPMPGGGYPAHPIAPGGQPPGIWGGPGGLPPVIMPPIVIPPGFIDGVHPEHPIVIVPPGIWGGRPPEYVDIGGPGAQPGPSHPIVIPPDLGIWGPTDPRPTHPIVIQPPTPTYPPRPTHPIVIVPPTEEGKPPVVEVMENWDVVTYWNAESGWGVAVIPSASHPGVPTPSRSTGAPASPPRPPRS